MNALFDNKMLIVGILLLVCPTMLVAYLSRLWERRNNLKTRLAISAILALCGLFWIDMFVKVAESPNGRPIPMNELPRGRDFACSGKFRDLFKTNVVYYGVRQSGYLGALETRFYCNTTLTKPWWVYRWAKTPSKLFFIERVCANAQGNPIISVPVVPE